MCSCLSKTIHLLRFMSKIYNAHYFGRVISSLITNLYTCNNSRFYQNHWGSYSKHTIGTILGAKVFSRLWKTIQTFRFMSKIYKAHYFGREASFLITCIQVYSLLFQTNPFIKIYAYMLNIQCEASLLIAYLQCIPCRMSIVLWSISSLWTPMPVCWLVCWLLVGMSSFP